jgi:hypothetical protein
MFARGVDQVDASIVRGYVKDLRNLLEESAFTERKAFLRSFVKKIVVDGNEVTVRYKLPLPPGVKPEERISVLTIETPGGPKPTIDRTFKLAFGLSI